MKGDINRNALKEFLIQHALLLFIALVVFGVTYLITKTTSYQEFIISMLSFIIGEMSLIIFSNDVIKRETKKRTTHSIAELMAIVKEDCEVQVCSKCNGVFCHNNTQCLFKDFMEFEVDRFLNRINDIEKDKYILDSNISDTHQKVSKSIQRLKIDEFNVIQYVEDDNEYLPTNADISFLESLTNVETMRYLKVINWIFVIKNGTNLGDFREYISYIVECLSDEGNIGIQNRFNFKCVTTDYYRQQKDLIHNSLSDCLSRHPDIGIYGKSFAFINDYDKNIGYFTRKNEIVLRLNDFFKTKLWNHNNNILAFEQFKEIVNK